MKKKCMRVFALALAISVLFVQVDTVSANAVANAPVVVQERPQIQNVGFVAEWVAGLGISAGRLVAFAFVLTLLGFVVENGISNAWENREEYLSYLTNLKKDFLDYCSESKEWCSVKANEFDLWLDMIAQGTLDKSNKCWQAIKDYCVDLKARIDAVNKPVDSSNSNVIKVENVGEWIDAQLATGISSTKLRNISVNQVSQYQTRLNSYLSSWGETFYYTQNTKFVNLVFNNTAVLLAINPLWESAMESDFYANCALAGSKTSSESCYSNDGKEGIPAFCGNRVFGGSVNLNVVDSLVSTFQMDYTLPNGLAYGTYIPVLLSLATGLVNGYDEWTVEIPKDDGIADEIAQGLTVAGGTSGVIERDGSLDNVDVVGVGGAVTDDVVPIDWDNVSVEDLVEPYPFDDVKTVDLVDGVIVGTDTPIDQITNPDGSTDTDTDRDNYTLSGLTELFPFCIPFDLVMLFRTLKADAKAPSFTWKFVYYVDGKKKTEDIEIDLSRFDSVAQLLRTMELLAFMVALTLKTRDLIRG